jgi:hypothetical protein
MKDMLGEIVKVLVTVKAEWLGALADLMEKLTSPHRESWFKNLKLFLRKEPCEWEPTMPVIPTIPTPTAWLVDDEASIHFTLTSNGFTSAQWESHFESRGWIISTPVRQLLHSAIEAPTDGTTYNIVVYTGKNERKTPNKICAVADKKGWVKTHWEVTCLIRDKFSDEQLDRMGVIYIITMHEHIKCSDGDFVLLGSTRSGNRNGLSAHGGRPDDYWYMHPGFAFEIPQPVN